MPIYIRFENNNQVETTTLENKPEGWHEAPENFSWQKSYCLTGGGEIVERTEEDIQAELLDNAKFCAFDSMRFYFNNHASGYAGHSLQKAKSYAIQAKAAENILASEHPFNEKDTQIIEPLAKVRGITVIEMAKLIQSKAQKATKAIAKCEELEDLAKKKIKEVKDEAELQSLLEHFKQEMQKVLTN